MKIIIRSPNWIGDCVMSIPAIKSLKKSLKSHEIFIVTKPNLKNIYLNMKELSGIITIPGKISFSNVYKVIKNISGYGIKDGLLFTNSLSSALLFKLSGVKRLTGFKKDMRSILLTKKKDFPGQIIHQIDFYKEIVSLFLGTKTENKFTNRIFLTESEREKAHLLLKTMGIEKVKKIVGIAPFTAYGSAKEWPFDNFLELIKKIKKRENTEIILFGSPDEDKKLHEMAEGSGSKIYFVSSDYSLREAIIIISRLNFFVGNDSGLMHIASCFNIPLLAIYGPTLPEKSFPRSDNANLLYNKVDCSPCNSRICPIDHNCMSSVKVSEVLKIILDNL